MARSSLPKGRPTSVFYRSPSEFGHGKTRNKAIAASQAPFVALITHDAEPADEVWLKTLVSTVEQSEDVAGAFGRHVANPGASPFTKRDIDEHFKGFLAHPLIVNRHLDPNRYERDVGWRQLLHFYSDNNSCLRRAVWEQIPYPDVEFAEDQVWAHRIIAEGYSKAYAPNAVVYHSHDFNPFERLQRSYDEAMAFRVLFGYDLSHSPREALRTVAALSARDLRFGYSEGFIRDRPLHVMGRMMENCALVLGHCLGAHSKKLPSWVSKRMSRDKRLWLQNQAGQ